MESCERESSRLDKWQEISGLATRLLFASFSRITFPYVVNLLPWQIYCCKNNITVTESYTISHVKNCFKRKLQIFMVRYPPTFYFVRRSCISRKDRDYIRPRGSKLNSWHAYNFYCRIKIRNLKHTPLIIYEISHEDVRLSVWRPNYAFIKHTLWKAVKKIFNRWVH
jgi:hypothetical protein